MPMFYKGKVLHELKTYFKNRRPATGLRGVKLLHDNASSHKAVIVREFLKQEKVVEFPHPPCLPNVAPCDFFLFPRLKTNTLLEENIKCEKFLFRPFSSV
jgi:histone-lysine N-methyltransferase SETMAR